jgi:transcriptional regulator with XRE-family HTH domain
MAGRRHGTLARYRIDRCRCQLCKDAKSAYVRNRARQLAYGRWQSYRDAEPCRRHVKALMESGLSLGRVAVLAGLGVSTVQKVMHGTRRSGFVPSEKVLARTAAAILSVRLDLDAIADTALINVAGTRRRVQALAAIGYSLKEQAEAVGRLPANYRLILTKGSVTAGTARTVRDLYDTWSMTPAPDTWTTQRTRRWAERQGWLPPMAWDDDLLDLTEEALEAAVREQAEQMSMEELQRCDHARRRLRDRSPLVVAASREYDRRRYQEAEARKRQEKEAAA